MADTHNNWTSDTALKALKDGNLRFASGNPTHPNSDALTRDNLAAHGQAPMAAILSCSDSRAPVEAIFDLGFGDIFSVRVAGAVPGVDELGSLEYAVAHLGTPLIVVLGHTKCGAVTAAVNGASEEGNLAELLAKLHPVVQLVATVPQEERVFAAIFKSVQIFRDRIPELSPQIQALVRENKVKIISAVYDIDTGKVTFEEP
ncbi:MAG: carbonic anhydrase [Deltaproteobacteria bacterium]|nr:carbonic anhydrase [Deltaproteobacteria bacterium]